MKAKDLAAILLKTPELEVEMLTCDLVDIGTVTEVFPGAERAEGFNASKVYLVTEIFGSGEVEE